MYQSITYISYVRRFFFENDQRYIYIHKKIADLEYRLGCILCIILIKSKNDGIDQTKSTCHLSSCISSNCDMLTSSNEDSVIIAYGQQLSSIN